MWTQKIIRTPHEQRQSALPPPVTVRWVPNELGGKAALQRLCCNSCFGRSSGPAGLAGAGFLRWQASAQQSVGASPIVAEGGEQEFQADRRQSAAQKLPHPTLLFQGSNHRFHHRLRCKYSPVRAPCAVSVACAESHGGARA